MKTKNNVQKTFLRTVAVIISFVLLSLTVTAQGYWKQLLINNSFNRIACALVDNHPNISSTTNNSMINAYADYTVEEDNNLTLEPWMVELDFDTQLLEENEAALVIEGWMMKSNYQESDEIIEKPLELEEWMF